MGSLVWVKINDTNKLEKQSEPHLFVGYGKDSYGYKVFNPRTQQFFFVREAIFNEKDTLKIEAKVSEDIEEYQDASDNESDDYVTLDLPKQSLYREFEDIKAGKELGRRNIVPPIRFRKDSALNVEEISIPNNYNQAINCEDKEKWIEAMNDEMDSMKSNQVWELVEKPKDVKVVSTKWIYTIKKDADGNIQRYKARFVARGFSQIEGVNVNETYSPVIRTESIRLLLNIAIVKNLRVRQFDIKTAFLNGTLDEIVYIKQPEGYDDGSGRVCLLKKALYGLKQSPRMWNQCFVNYLKSLGFNQCSGDQCVLKKDEMIVGLHVDDFIVLYDDEGTLRHFITSITSKFDVKDLGELNYFLNVKIERTNTSFLLSQKRFIEEAVEEFGLSEAKPLYTPLDPSIKLSINQCPTNDKDINEMRKYPYRELIGKLNYLSQHTRPDISIAVSKLSRFMNNPGKIHWKLALKVMRYLKTTSEYTLELKPENFVLSAYSDADWAGEIDDRRSTSGHCILVGGSIISWKTKLQSAISLSTMESEFYALTYTLQEIKAINIIMEELGIIQESPIVIFEDNQSTIKFSNNTTFKGRAKHIDLRYNFVREAIRNKLCTIKYCDTNMMIADMLTKPVERTKLEKCCKMFRCHSPLKGSVEIIEKCQ